MFFYCVGIKINILIWYSTTFSWTWKVRCFLPIFKEIKYFCECLKIPQVLGTEPVVSNRSFGLACRGGEIQTLVLVVDVIIFLASEVLKGILTILFLPLEYKNMISPFVPTLVWARGRKLIKIWGCVAFPTVILSCKHTWVSLSVFWNAKFNIKHFALMIVYYCRWVNQASSYLL